MFMVNLGLVLCLVIDKVEEEEIKYLKILTGKLVSLCILLEEFISSASWTLLMLLRLVVTGQGLTTLEVFFFWIPWRFFRTLCLYSDLFILFPEHVLWFILISFALFDINNTVFFTLLFMSSDYILGNVSISLTAFWKVEDNVFQLYQIIQKIRCWTNRYMRNIQ